MDDPPQRLVCKHTIYLLKRLSIIQQRQFSLLLFFIYSGVFYLVFSSSSLPFFSLFVSKSVSRLHRPGLYVHIRTERRSHAIFYCFPSAGRVLVLCLMKRPSHRCSFPSSTSSSSSSSRHLIWHASLLVFSSPLHTPLEMESCYLDVASPFAFWGPKPGLLFSGNCQETFPGFSLPAKKRKR